MCEDIDKVLFYWVLSWQFGQSTSMLDDEPGRKRRRLWVHPIVAQRQQKGQFHKLYTDLRQDANKFKSYCRMSIETFDCLLICLHPDLNFMDTCMRHSISAEQRLLVTLRFLATGNSFASLHFEFLLGISTISGIVGHTCKVIWQRLREAVMPTPTAADLLRFADGVYQSAQFSNCIGARDGKHIRVKKPPHSGSRYFDYKQYFSVVLMALADSDYKFVIVDIGAYGSTSDSRIFSVSRMGERLRQNQLALPEPSRLPGSAGPPASFVIVADEGFAVSPHLMRPFPRCDLDVRKRIFNRRYVECAFGILSSKCRVFQSSIQMKLDNATLVIQACVMLHNFTRIHDASTDADLGLNMTSSVSLDLSRPG